MHFGNDIVHLAVKESPEHRTSRASNLSFEHVRVWLLGQLCMSVTFYVFTSSNLGSVHETSHVTGISTTSVA
jgi:hypothetical protein